MEARLTTIDRGELLRCLRLPGEPDPATSEAIERCEAELLAAARPRAVWRLFGLLPDRRLEGTDFMPEGDAIRAHLAGCAQVILMAATLGTETESLLRRAQLRDLADAVLLDAAASAAIENVCDNLCADLAAVLAPKALTARFSPGYGDFPLRQQAQLFRVLDVERRIGVTLTAGGLMLPQKSVTALIGVSAPARAPTPEARGCAFCPRFHDCEDRKEGKPCGSRRTSDP